MRTLMLLALVVVSSHVSTHASIADEKVHSIKVTYADGNREARCEGSTDDLLDFLQIIIAEQKKADAEEWRRPTTEITANDWLHQRHLGERRQFVRIASEILDGKRPLRIDLTRSHQGTGFARAVEIWGATKSAGFFDSDTAEPRRIHVTNPTPSAKSLAH